MQKKGDDATNTKYTHCIHIHRSPARRSHKIDEQLVEQVIRVGGQKRTIQVKSYGSHNQSKEILVKRASVKQITIASPPLPQRTQMDIRMRKVVNTIAHPIVSQPHISSQTQIKSQAASPDMQQLRNKTLEIQRAILHNKNLSSSDREQFVERLQNAEKTITSNPHANKMLNSLATMIDRIHSQLHDTSKHEVPLNDDDSDCSYMKSFDEGQDQRDLPVFGEVKLLARRVMPPMPTLQNSLEAQLNKVMELLMEQYDDTQQRSHQILETESDDSILLLEELDDDLKKEKKSYARRVVQDPFVTPYYIHLINSYSFDWVRFEYKIYQDDYPLLKVRKYLVFIGSTISVACSKVVETQAFLFVMLSVICLNLALFIYSNANDGIITNGYPAYMSQLHTGSIQLLIIIVLLLIYSSEATMKILAFGFVTFLNDEWNIFNVITTIMFAIHVNMPQIIPIDISPIRMIRIIIVLSLHVKTLHVMIVAIQESARFLMEALLIVFIFGLYFSLQGLHLFTGVFKNRCVSMVNGIPQNPESLCGYQQCDPPYECVKLLENLSIADNYDNIVYAFFQMLRSATRINWSGTMYYTMTAFHAWTWIYFIMIIFIVGVFGFNVIIAVLKVHYNQVLEAGETEQQEPPIQKMNVNILRHFGLYKILQQLHTKKIQHLAHRKSVMSNIFTVDPLLEQQEKRKMRQTVVIKVDWQKDMDNINFEILNKDEKFLLSARQRREVKSLEDQYQEEDHDDSKWTSCLKQFQVKSILLPNRRFESLNYEFMNQFEKKTEIDSRLRRILRQLKNQELLAWRKEINFTQHCQSTSELDVELLPKHKTSVKLKSVHSQKRFFLFENQDLVDSNKLKFHQMQKRKTRIPLCTHRKPKTESQMQDKDSALAQKTYAQHHKAIMQLKQKVRTINLANAFVKGDIKLKFISKQKKNEIMMNGVVYRYEELARILNRVVSNENDCKYLSVQQELNEMSKEYTEYQLQEQTQKALYANIWSGDDVGLEQSSFVRKRHYFHSLNNVDRQIYLKGVVGFLSVTHKYILRAIRMPEVGIFFDVCIAIDLIFLTFNGIIADDLVKDVNDATTALLFLELLMRLISIKISKFFKSQCNTVDAFVVLVNVIEFFFSQTLVQEQENQSLKMMGAIKAILAYRIIRYYSFAIRMMNLAIASLPSYLNLTFMMFVLVFFFAFIGQELFQGRYDMMHSETGQMHSFADVGKAWMTVFQLSTNDGWSASYTLGNTFSSIWATNIYFLLIIYMVNYMMFGFVIAIILEIFQKFLVEGDTEEEKQMIALQALNGGQLNVPQIMSSPISLRQEIPEEEELPDQNKKFLDVKKQIALVVQNFFKGSKLYEKEDCENSLFFFRKDSKFRQGCYKFIKFKQVVLASNFVVIISIINIAFSTYMVNDLEQKIFHATQFACNLWFLFEAIIKIISFGLCWDKGSYLQEIWRAIDFAYVCAFFIHLAFKIENPVMSIMLTLCFLRPIKVIFMFQGLAEIKDAISQSLSDILSVLIILLSVWLIFAIFGITLYRNRLGFCEDKMEFYVDKTECLHEGKRWLNYIHNFDDITHALPTLFVLATLDEWGEHLQVCSNSFKEDHGPRPYANQWSTYVFFFLFVFVGAMFLLGFFMGVLFINFQANRIKLMNPDLTEDQSLFLNISKTILQEQPYYSDAPKSALRVFAFKMLKNTSYHNVIVFAIIINTSMYFMNSKVVLAIFYETASDSYKITLNTFHHITSWVLIFDTFVKILAYGWVRYISQFWRQLELFVSVVSLIDFALDMQFAWFRYYIHSGFNDPYYRLARLFFILRDIRILLIIQEFQGLTRLLSVLGFTLTLLFKILFVFLIVICVYVFIANYLFGQIDKGAIIDGQINFSNFHSAALTLFKCASGDHWRFIMVDCTPNNPYCADNNKYCGTQWAYVYFISFMLLSNFVMLNLFILALVDQFESFFNSQNNVVQTYIEHIDKFRTVWCKYTYDSKGKKMHTRFLANFLLELGQPLGCQYGDNIWDAAKNASNFHIRQDMNGYLHFKEVLYETIKFANKEKTFKIGTQEGLSQMKSHDKNMRFSLHYRRTSITNRRFPIQNKMELRGNFNILQEYFYLLQVFKTWQSYSQRIFQVVEEQQYEYSETSLNSLEESQDSLERQESIHLDLKEVEEECLDKRRCSWSDDDGISQIATQLPKYYTQAVTRKKSSVKHIGLPKQPDFIFKPDLNRQTHHQKTQPLQDNDEKQTPISLKYQRKDSHLADVESYRVSNMQYNQSSYFQDHNVEVKLICKEGAKIFSKKPQFITITK